MKKKLSALLSLLMLLSVLLTIQFASAAAPGRPVITAGETIKTATGELIRSGVAWYAKQNDYDTPEVLDYHYWIRAKKAGLNAIRITNWDHRYYVDGTYDNPGPYTNVWSISENLDRIDTMVAHANTAGLYVIITPGDQPGSYSREYLEHFWGQAAARYKNNTNVIYEITNEPVEWRPEQYTNAILDDLAAVYQIMRAAAPNTPILSLTFANTNNSMLAKVQYFTTQAGIVWGDNRDVVSFHPYGSSSFDYVDQLRDSGYPVMNTEFNYVEFENDPLPTFGFTYPGQKFEQEGISWMNFRSGRSDGRFTEHYDYVNDAKAKGYYWKPGTQVIDNLDDWTKLAEDGLGNEIKSANMQLLSGNSINFDGDISRATRSTSSQGYIVYEAAGLRQFDARIYSNNEWAGLKFYVSHNGDDWQNIAVTRTNNTGPVSTWNGGNFKSTNGLPAGTNFLKIEMNSTATFGIQISSVKFTAWIDDYSHIEDKMNAWSVVHDRYNVKFDTLNPSFFPGDGSRVKIDNTAENGYVVYELEDMGGFYAHVYFRTPNVTYPVSSSVLAFSTSTNGTSWTATTMVTKQTLDPVETDNGWKITKIENMSSLPADTKYVKVEFKVGPVQLGEIDVYGKYE